MKFNTRSIKILGAFLISLMFLVSGFSLIYHIKKLVELNSRLSNIKQSLPSSYLYIYMAPETIKFYEKYCQKLDTKTFFKLDQFHFEYYEPNFPGIYDWGKIAVGPSTIKFYLEIERRNFFADNLDIGRDGFLREFTIHFYDRSPIMFSSEYCK